MKKLEVIKSELQDNICKLTLLERDLTTDEQRQLDTYLELSALIDDTEIENYLAKESLGHFKEKCEDYKKFVHFMTDEAVGDVKQLAITIDELESFKVIGLLDCTLEVKNNKLVVVTEVDEYGNGNKKTIHCDWQPYDNYATYQRVEFEDCYYGYLLFPTSKQNKWFCISFTC